MTRSATARPEEPEVCVWLVEDKRILRRNLATLIEEQPGMTCPLAAETCEEMLAGLDEGLIPDIVLMDIGLPGMSGIEGVRRLRSLSPGSRAIILTVHEEDEQVFDAICAGASGYLLKPSSPQDVIAAIHQVRRGAAPINAYIASKLLSMFARLTPLPPPDDGYRLTPREKEILQLLVDGLTMREIAERLNVSYHTVDNHVRNIYDKLHVHSRSGVVAKALKERLV